MQAMQANASITIGSVTFGNHLPFSLIAGPCQMESRDHALEMADALSTTCQSLGIGFVFKASFDKANRTSIQGQRGIGLANALPVFAEIKSRYHCPVLTDVHTENQCQAAAEIVDILQIPAFLCRQTDLLIAAAKTGRVINVKKGQFLAPWDMEHVAKKLVSSGNNNVLLTERGATFGYNNLVVDMRSLDIMKQFHAPIIFDATHSVQQPGGLQGASGGQRHFVPVLARAAVAVGVAGLFMETHQDPDHAPSDGPCMVILRELRSILEQLIAIDRVVKSARAVSA